MNLCPGGRMKTLVRMLFACFIVVFATACKKSEMVSIYNGCIGSWMRITDGQNRIVTEKLTFGARISVEYPRPPEGSYNQRVLNADGFRLDNNEPLGATSYTFSLYGDANITGPRENAWNITSLPRGCPTK